jgi:group I intron endonuclease
MGYIYKITNIVNNKCYIGETVQEPRKRWIKHISSVNTTKDCPVLAAAMNKYGIDKFKFEVLIICFDEDRHKYEKEYIKKYNSQRPNGYNILDGGQYGGSRLGTKLSEETKTKVSKALKEFHKDNPNNFEKYREKHSMVMKNSEKWKQSMAERILPKYTISSKSDAVKEKIRESVKKYFETNGSCTNKKKHSKIMTKINGRSVEQYSKDSELIARFDSIKHASVHTSAKRSSIQAAAAGRIKMAGGFIWKYAEKELKDISS